MMRFLLPAALAIALLTGFVTTEIGATWSAHAPTLALLVVIILLLWRQQSQRDFYVVRQLSYGLDFKEHPGVIYVTADRGSLIGGHTHSFSDFGAAKAFFDHIEEPSPPNVSLKT
jgi:hypothetical protein